MFGAPGPRMPRWPGRLGVGTRKDTDHRRIRQRAGAEVSRGAPRVALTLLDFGCAAFREQVAIRASLHRSCRCLKRGVVQWQSGAQVPPSSRAGGDRAAVPVRHPWSSTTERLTRIRSLRTASALLPCGMTSASLAYCWSLNSSGEVGNGTRPDRRTPTRWSNRRSPGTSCRQPDTRNHLSASVQVVVV